VNLSEVKALLIDIDDTITRFKTGPDGQPVINPSAASLFGTFLEAAVELGGLSREEAQARIDNISKNVEWWRLSDFVVDLGLDPHDYWDYAYRRESAFLEPTGPDLGPALRRLNRAGLKLYITSNNPADGILHKLRLAGLGHIHGAPLFQQFLGPPEMKAMKWDLIYWKRVLVHIGFRGGEVAVVGDALRDDYEMPRAAGIAGTFLIRRDGVFTEPDSDALLHVRSFKQIADLVLKARAPKRAKAPRAAPRRRGAKAKRA
jgi:FMN phosphatase YigB (HAD superfamily)